MDRKGRCSTQRPFLLGLSLVGNLACPCLARYHAHTMHWHKGLKRLRIVATAALVLGLLIFIPITLMNVLGYLPDPGFVGLFSFLAHLGLPFVILGAILWIAVWVVQGFVPEVAANPTQSRFER